MDDSLHPVRDFRAIVITDLESEGIDWRPAQDAEHVIIGNCTYKLFEAAAYCDGWRAAKTAFREKLEGLLP